MRAAKLSAWQQIINSHDRGADVSASVLARAITPLIMTIKSQFSLELVFLVSTWIISTALLVELRLQG